MDVLPLKLITARMSEGRERSSALLHHFESDEQSLAREKITGRHLNERCKRRQAMK